MRRFPLTPALSLWERENRTQSLDKTRGSVFVDARPTMLPAHEPCVARRSKPQDPRSRKAPNPKIQGPWARRARCVFRPARDCGHDKRPGLVFGVWRLVFIWSLDLGAWCFKPVQGFNARSSISGNSLPVEGRRRRRARFTRERRLVTQCGHFECHCRRSRISLWLQTKGAKTRGKIYHCACTVRADNT